MAIITCERCGKKYSDKAPACPNCSDQLTNNKSITCPLCHSQSMTKGTVPLVYDSIIRFFGYLIAIPSIIVLGFSLAEFLHGSPYVAGIMLGTSIFEGLIGFGVLSHRPAMICHNCRHYQLINYQIIKTGGSNHEIYIYHNSHNISDRTNSVRSFLPMYRKWENYYFKCSLWWA